MVKAPGPTWIATNLGARHGTKRRGNGETGKVVSGARVERECVVLAGVRFELED